MSLFFTFFIIMTEKIKNLNVKDVLKRLSKLEADVAQLKKDRA
jgi:hypothetical protein